MALKMRIKVTKEQFYLLLANFQILSDKELALQMGGNTFNKIVESKKSYGASFRVKLLFGSQPVEVDVVTPNNASAMVVIKKMFPNSKIVAIKKN